MRPLTFAIYKGLKGSFGCIQFNFSPPHYYKDRDKSFDGLDSKGESIFEGFKFKDGWKEREGCVFVEITSTSAPNVYDWEKKIVMALSVNDISQVLFGLRTGDEVKLTHDPGAKSDSQGQVQKYLNITSPKGVLEGVMIRASQTKGGETTSHTVPLKGHEVMALAELLKEAICKSLSW